MGIKVKAKQTKLQIGEAKGSYRFILQADTYSTLSDTKVIKDASLRSGLSKGVIKAAWDAIGSVVSTWATEGHSVSIPGLGHMRFGIRATSVENINDVSAKLITSRRVIFVPSVEIKQELANTNISITCYDKDGVVIKTVASTDKDDIEVDDGNTFEGNTPPPTGEDGGNSGGDDNAGL